jgi:hypothetical protein
VSFRVRGPNVEMPAEGTTTTEGAIVRWRRAAVMTGRKGRAGDETPSYRFFLLELDESAIEQRIDFEGFYVRGRFRICVKENNTRRALEAWKAFVPEER